jgi:hypothetical protein
MATQILTPKAFRWLLAATLPCAAVVALRAAAPDEPFKEPVGIVEGDAISLQGPMSASVVNGQVKTVLRSGGELRVKSGRATIDLVEGGKIAVCGPAHLSVLKSGGALTVALDSGTVHSYVNQVPSLTIYTALLQAKPLAIGGGPQETLVSLDANGGLSVRAITGAVRIEQQLSGQSVVVPQSGDVFLNNGQLNGMKPGAGRGSCDLGELNIQPLPEVSVPATAEEVKQRRLTDAKPNLPNARSNAAAADGPIYQVFLPPMRFDANLKVQAPPDPNLIVLVRRVRVRPTLIFEGRVEGEALIAENRSSLPVTVTTAAKSSATASAQAAAPAVNPSVADRVRTFFKRVWGPKS